MNRKEFNALTQIEGIHGDINDGELDILCIPVQKYTPEFYQFIQDKFNIVLLDVSYNYVDAQLEAWFEEA